MRSLTCDQLPDLQVCGLAKQSHQRWDATTVFQGDLVVIISLPIYQVPQSPTGTTVDFRHPVIQQVHQELYASLSPYLKEQGEQLWPWRVKFHCLSPRIVFLRKPTTNNCPDWIRLRKGKENILGSHLNIRPIRSWMYRFWTTESWKYDFNFIMGASDISLKKTIMSRAHGVRMIMVRDTLLKFTTVFKGSSWYRKHWK